MRKMLFILYMFQTKIFGSFESFTFEDDESDHYVYIKNLKRMLHSITKSPKEVLMLNLKVVINN